MYYSTVQGCMMFIIYILRLSAYFVYVHMFMAVQAYALKQSQLYPKLG